MPGHIFALVLVTCALMYHRGEILSCLQSKLADLTTKCRVTLRREQLEKVHYIVHCLHNRLTVGITLFILNLRVAVCS